MREATIQAVRSVLGEPTEGINNNEKVIRWNVNDDLDVVVQRDASESQGKIWTTLRGDVICEHSGACVYKRNVGRHSGTLHHCPTLERGQPALCITVKSKGDLSEAIRYVKALRDSPSCKDLLVKRSITTIEFIQEGLGPLLKAFGLVKYLPVPGVASLGSISADAASVLEGLDKRSKQQRFRRLELLQEATQAKLDELEVEMLESSEHVDLFAQVVETAIADDEEKKQVLYAGILAWILANNPRAMHVRVISDAVSALSYLELYWYLHIIAGKSIPKEILNQVEESVFYNRVDSWGLSQGGSVRQHGNPSLLGQQLIACTKLSDLPLP